MPTVACAEYGGVAVVCGASACALYAVGGSRLSDASKGEGALASVEVVRELVNDRFQSSRLVLEG